jgi:TolB-like protein
MSGLIPYIAAQKFGNNDIDQQLKRIFLHPDFVHSEILRKFLSFVVSETLIGNACLLKEYTIALKVLAKPSNFNPQQNCIVRIHALRLRNALAHYYNNLFNDDEIVIDMPKGKYVPVFKHRDQWLEEIKGNWVSNIPGAKRVEMEPATFAILPFICNSGGEPIKLFCDNLCMNICSALSQMEQISVIGFQAIRGLVGDQSDIKGLSTMLRFNHFVSGGIQDLKHRVRINIQIVDCRSFQQVWSKIFEYKMTASNLFEVQDEICQAIAAEVKTLTITK